MTKTEALERIEGLFVGQLDEDEKRLFDDAVMHGWAYRSYEGHTGWMGLATVRLTNQQ